MINFVISAFDFALLKLCLVNSLVVCLAAFNCSAQTAELPEEQVDVQRLIGELDAEKYATRRRAERSLIQIGVPALPGLRKAMDHNSAETRMRADRAAFTIEFELLRDEFRALSRATDAKMDLEKGMWLVARILNLDCKKETLDTEIDAMVERVRGHLGADVIPAQADPRQVVGAMQSVFKEMGFQGNYQDYDNPKNSSVESVLATKKGLPILLSHVMVAVAERLDVPIVGLAIPHRYMVKYDGSRAPAGFPETDIIIDPFGDWEAVTPEKLRQTVQDFDADVHLKPCSNRATLHRMMVNLSVHLERAGDKRKASQVAEYTQLFAPSKQRVK